MPASEARINANRQNSLKSTGPKTSEGKERSRQNGLKHGMTGQGVVVAQAQEDRLLQTNRHILLEVQVQAHNCLGNEEPKT